MKLHEDDGANGQEASSRLTTALGDDGPLVILDSTPSSFTLPLQPFSADLTCSPLFQFWS